MSIALAITSSSAARSSGSGVLPVQTNTSAASVHGSSRSRHRHIDAALASIARHRAIFGPCLPVNAAALILKAVPLALAPLSLIRNSGHSSRAMRMSPAVDSRNAATPPRST